MIYNPLIEFLFYRFLHLLSVGKGKENTHTCSEASLFGVYYNSPLIQIILLNRKMIVFQFALKY